MKKEHRAVYLGHSSVYRRYYRKLFLYVRGRLIDNGVLEKVLIRSKDFFIDSLESSKSRIASPANRDSLTFPVLLLLLLSLFH